MKRVMAGAFAFGAGFALVGGLGLATFSWWSSRPLVWDSQAITASFDSILAEGPERELVFDYILSNNTDKDFRIDLDAEVRSAARLQRQGALATENSKEVLAADLPLFIPAKQRTRLSIRVGYHYQGSAVLLQGRSKADREQDEKTLVAFLREDSPNLDGFVLFHEPTHFQIELPSGWKKQP